MWAARFNLPPNDPRLLRLTGKEALEQINALAALKELVREQQEEVRAQQPTPEDFALQQQTALGGEALPHTAQISTRTDAKARAIADTAHLIGDPEWDGLELLELDPAKPPLDIAGLPGR